jgi:hypothetical protein
MNPPPLIPRLRSALPPLAVIVLAGALAACGATGGGDPEAKYPTAQVTVTFAIGGSVQLDGSFTYKPAEATPCRALTQGGNGAYEVPGGDGNESIKGTPAELIATIDDYSGPGTYSGENIDPGSVSITVDNSSVDQPFQPTSSDNANATATVQSNGGGKFVFSDWYDANAREVSGTVTWTCTDVPGTQ